MIRAAAQYADDPQAGAPPPELALWWECQDAGALPEAGGLWDQPAGLVRRMRACAHVARVWPDYWKLPRAEFEQRHPGGMAVVNWVLRLKADGRTGDG